MAKIKSAKLILSNGRIFEGFSFGYEKSVSGEAVFNTGMTGYPETLTDSSYSGQILVLTYPLVGNYGLPKPECDLSGICSNFESEKIHVKALVVSEHSKDYSHWNAAKSLQDWLKEEKIAGVFGVDTREITKELRVEGAMLAKVVIGRKDVKFTDPNKRNLAAEVSCREPFVYGSGKKKIALIDTGAKHRIIRSLIERKVSVIRFPWNYDIFNSGYDFDAVLVSNGPGDPKMCGKAIETVKAAMEYNLPTFGICLGNQLLALAAGADTYKLKFGHRSQNQPCIEVGTKRCYITSQNHGYAVDEKTLPKEWTPWFRNLNDGTNEGIKHARKPFMSVQFHPEATPGPVDTAFLFDKFLELIP